MRKFKPSRPCLLPFRPLLIVAAASLLMSAVAPSTKADLIAYFNFEDSTIGGSPDFTSEADQGLGIATTIMTNYNPADITTVSSTFTDNRWPTDVDPPLLALGMASTANNSPGDFDIPLLSSTGLFQDMTLSFAVNVAGSGFTMAVLWYSIDGGATFINSGNSVVIPISGVQILSLAVPTAANNQPLLVLRLEFTGGQSNGGNIQDIIDNIRVEGTITGTPSPTPTVTPTTTPTATATATPTSTATFTPTPTATATASATPTTTATPTATATATPTATATFTPTPTATATATPTPTSTPSCIPIVIEGSIDDTDPTQTDKLNRSGIPQTCPATTTCAIFGDGLLHHYDSYTFTSTSGSTQCVAIDTNTACMAARFIFTAAYLGSFDPNNICTNWIGDSGFSPDPDQAFQVEVPAGETLVVVVSNVTADATCPDYTVTITGLCTGTTPSPTPTSTARPTPIPRGAHRPRARPTPPPHITPVPPPPSPRPTAAPRPTPPPHLTPVPTPSSPRPTPAPRP